MNSEEDTVSSEEDLDSSELFFLPPLERTEVTELAHACRCAHCGIHLPPVLQLTTIRYDSPIPEMSLVDGPELCVDEGRVCKECCEDVVNGRVNKRKLPPPEGNRIVRVKIHKGKSATLWVERDDLDYQIIIKEAWPVRFEFNDDDQIIHLIVCDCRGVDYEFIHPKLCSTVFDWLRLSMKDPR